MLKDRKIKFESIISYSFSAPRFIMMCEYSGKLTEALVLARTRATELEKVRKLNCWGSDVIDVSIVRKMPNLEVCSLSVNGITTLKDFSYCQNLQELYIRRNAIENLSEICHLKTLPKLRSLWIADNPCCNRKNYRPTVLRHLPNLQKLDNIAVTEDEVNAAVEEGDDLSLTDSSTSNPSLKESEPESETTDDEPLTDDTRKAKDSRLNEVVTLTMEETNKIRAQLGLKPLPQNKMTPPRSVASGTTKSRNSHILQAVLLLIKELDSESLEVVGNAVKNRLESL